MSYSRLVFLWLLVGLIMVYFQIIIGGVTRLTGSGLSITKWEIVTGTIPPLNGDQWQAEFDAYKATPQYEKLNEGMSMRDFKFIYFWEYVHRLWARVMGFVFLFPFLWFYAKRKIPDVTKKDLGIVVLLAALAAGFGWIMVASGLVNRPWVNAYKLSVHLLIGVAVFTYLLWTILRYRLETTANSGVGRGTNLYGFWFIVVILVQLAFGGWMSGMKAALIYPTWPDIGGHFIPPDVLDRANWKWINFVEYDRTGFVFGLVHFIHRGLAYIILIVAGHYAWKKGIFKREKRLKGTYALFAALLLIQVVIGIGTLLSSVGEIPVLWGVLHQGVAVLVLSSFVIHYFHSTRWSIK